MLLRPDLEALLAGPQKVVPNDALFRVVVAVHQLENLAIHWCGGKMGNPSSPSLPPPPHPYSQKLRCPHQLLLLLALQLEPEADSCLLAIPPAKDSSAAVSCFCDCLSRPSCI